MPTDTKLREALAKMRPEMVFFNPISGNLNEIALGKVTGRTILDTELLHLCWLVEETLDKTYPFPYWDALTLQISDKQSIEVAVKAAHATWQQRVIALCKVKGIEIV